MSEEPKPKTWRDLKNDTPKTVSWRARFRSFMRFFRRLVYVSLFVAVCVFAYKAYEDGTIKRAMTPDSSALKTITYRTDGTVNKAWLLRNGYFPPSIDLAEIDIIALKEKFEALAQIKSVEIEKNYPDKLTIHVSERRPIARLAVLRADKLDIYCLASDGAFFAPIEIPQDRLDTLAWVTGVPLVYIAGRLEPFARAPKLEQFLTAAKLKLPDHFRTWQTVNVRETGSVTLPIIVVTTIHNVKLIFHADDLAQGFEKLEYVLRFCKETNLIDIDKNVEKIDLTMKGQAVLSPRKNHERQ